VAPADSTLRAMCGIAGILRTWRAGEAPPETFEAIPEAWLDVLDESIKHRGPDGCGRFRQRVVRADGTVVDVALVHRRLSIIDHACGAQPMALGSPPLRGGSSASDPRATQPDTPLISREGLPYGPLHALACPKCGPGVVAVVFNGCIYNHRELRRELEAAGHEFFTDHSDTEVLLHGWREWGERLGQRLEGMYGAGIWDSSVGTLALGRDFAHEKPLFFSGSSSDTAFASVPAALICLDRRRYSRPGRSSEEWSSRPGPSSEDWISDWIRFGASEDPACGSAYRWPWHGMMVDVRWWGASPDDRANFRRRELPVRGSGEPLTIDVVDHLLMDSVNSRMQADVPLGIFLSGGIDSSLIAHYAKRAAGRVGTFCVRMDDARYDESPAAAHVAATLGTEHTTLDVDPDPARDLEMLVKQLGLPFGDSSLLPTYWLSRAVRDVARVALSGDGGDELFVGYERYLAAPRLRRHRSWLSRVPTWMLPQRDPKSRASKAVRLIRAARQGGYWDLLSIFPMDDLRQLCPELDFAWYSGLDPNDPPGDEFWIQFANDLLSKVDTASMSVALEVRAPFLSSRLIESALSAPLDSLTLGGQRKGLLRAVASKYLPAEIVDRPKMGFAIPVGEWFRSDYGGMRQLLYDHLESADPFPGLAEAGVEVNMGFVRRMLREHDAAGEKSLNPWHGRDHSQRLYMLLVLSIWCRWLRGLGSGQ